MELKSPLHIHWEITNKCNFNCMQCFQKNDENQVLLSNEELLVITDRIIDAKVFQVSISGGEPFLTPILPQVIKRLVDNKVDVLVCSNGSCIEDKDIRLLLEYEVPIQISIDSHIPEKNNYIRGNANAFEMAVDSIRKLKNYDANVSVAFCASKLNYMDLFGVAELCQKLQVDNLVVGEMLPPFGDSNNPNLFTHRDYRDFLKNAKFVKDVFSEKLEIFINTNWGFVFDEDFEHAPCTALDRDFAILYNGFVVPCPFIRNSRYYIGNVLEESVSSIWKKGKDTDFYKYKHKGCDNSSCLFYNKCLSGCKAELANNNFDLDRRDPRCVF